MCTAAAAAHEGAGHVDGMHDNARLCALSVREEMPVIIVNVGYRLNWLGFLACSGLANEAKLDGKGGASGQSPAKGVFNVGLYDQRRAFDWIQNNIAGFEAIQARLRRLGRVQAVFVSCTTCLRRRSCFGGPCYKGGVRLGHRICAKKMLSISGC
jgi:hypothetical protein